jgi:hypothetical protein
MDITDIINEKFNNLTVQKFLRKELVCVGTRRMYKYYYSCKCECGRITEVQRNNLMFGHTKSCGCLRRRKGKENKCWNGCGDLSGRIWSGILSKARERNLDVDVSIEDAWAQYEKQKGKCALTGWPIDFNYGKGHYSDKTASLDRIDNTKGYVKDNIQWLHKDVNWMKGRFETCRFKEICNAVAEYKGGV